MEKQKKMISFENLPAEIQEMMKKKYPNGFIGHTHKVATPKETFNVVNFDTTDVYYMVKVKLVDKKAKANDDDDDESFADDEFSVPDTGGGGLEEDKDEFGNDEEEDNYGDKPEEGGDDDDDDDDEV